MRSRFLRPGQNRANNRRSEREEAHICPIFWFRGFPPSDWYPELPVADDPFVEDFGSLDIMGGHVFTDGNGRALRPKTSASVAVVLVSLGSSRRVALLSTLGGRAGILHCRNQSVARTELLAAVEALRLSRKATRQVIIWTDCMFVINGFARGRQRKHSSHAYRWEEFWKAHDANGPPCLAPQGLEKPRSFHHWKPTVTRLQTSWQQEELCVMPFPWSTSRRPAAQTSEIKTCCTSKTGRPRPLCAVPILTLPRPCVS